MSDYEDIRETALVYFDRERGPEVEDRFDVMLRMVEAKINRELRVLDMSNRVVTDAVVNQEYYLLPDNFGGIRAISVHFNDRRTTPEYREPRGMDEAFNAKYSGTEDVFYTITDGRFRILPLLPEGAIIEIVYYRKVPPLCPGKTNWVSLDHPDLYNTGLLREMSRMFRDPDMVVSHGRDFDEIMTKIDSSDSRDRWSGTPTYTRTDVSLSTGR